MNATAKDARTLPSILTQPIQISEKAVEPSGEELLKMREFIYQACGISLGEDKRYLIVQRFAPLLKETGCKNFTEFHQRLLSDSGKLKERLVEAITTNETSFFRDGHPFEAFRDNIFAIMAARIKGAREKTTCEHKVRIWCAASSTGQEPYSWAILINERLESGSYPYLRPSDFQIVATDISGEVLARAAKGEYSQIEVSRGLPDEFKKRYFRAHGANWKVVDPIRRMIDFRQMNLIKPFTSFGSFDMIACRNVLIYFDDKTKTKILEQFYEMLIPGGVLILGAMENTYGLCPMFHSKKVGKTILYEKH